FVRSHQYKPVEIPVTTITLVSDAGGLRDFIYWRPDAVRTGMEPVYVILNALLDSGRFTRKLILLGLSGTFSYIFGSIVATLGMGLVVDYLGWGATFIVLILSAVFAIIFTLMSRERSLEFEKE
ncbi:hypothetical protein ACWZX0_004359, partial [Shigella flexneri]